MNIAQFLRQCRKESGLSLKQLEIKSGVPASTISFLRAGTGRTHRVSNGRAIKGARPIGHTRKRFNFI